jgi:MerR family transcriptional regulator, thiopeptide resistance regulator
MTARRTYQVSDVAGIAGVSVRALHHYDAIGLLVPSARTSAGYRLYDDADLLRLQQILIGRELGLSLESIRKNLDDPSFDLKSALVAQKKDLDARASRTAEMLRSVEAALEALAQEGDTPMNTRALFDGFDPSRFEDEARERWGHTDAYRISAERTKSYTKEDWARFSAEQSAIYADAIATMKAGVPPDHSAAMDIAERARLSIDRWFYPCSHAMHEKLVTLYETDRRFADNIDKHGEGLTAFLVAAIRANARRVAE